MLLPAAALLAFGSLLGVEWARSVGLGVPERLLVSDMASHSKL
jgi:hypothetical protein